ncbi:hypothetical protein DPEC_G00068670 [Dallia pectoralis]|uniref:Uncharacterized protein n=1 Tax=Dallia pectoralis TaxID=75939 RepID=A0ACC2H273_DALPE|nr:hypothetical protein DPEC_G00068670 [Dallia pectoralis]
MNGSFRQEILFSDHATLSLFECLIVAGAPATGLLQDTAFKNGGSLQMTLRLLRDMWQRADMLYIPRADLESLHRMECSGKVYHEMPIHDQIALDARKLSRYYIYLLFRYCMSAAGPTPYNQPGVMSNCSIGVPQWEPKKYAAPLLDIPGTWLGAQLCTNSTSAPPIPQGNFESWFPIHNRPQQQPQQLPKSLDSQRYQHQKLQQPQQARTFPQEIDYTKHRDQRHPAAATTTNKYIRI